MVRKIFLTLVLVMAVSLATPAFALADGQYGQGTEEPTPEEVIVTHEPVETGLGDLNPLVVVVGAFGASVVFYFLSKQSTQVLG